LRLGWVLGEAFPAAESVVSVVASGWADFGDFDCEHAATNKPATAIAVIAIFTRIIWPLNSIVLVLGFGGNPTVLHGSRKATPMSALGHQPRFPMASIVPE
jgi:hypothetical protein